MTKELDFTAYDNPEDVLGYVGFISPEGRYYIVRAYGVEEEGTHPFWSYFYVKSLSGPFKYTNCLDIVLAELKFMIYTEDKENNSIKCFSLESDLNIEYNSIQLERFNELKKLYDMSIGDNYGRKN